MSDLITLNEHWDSWGVPSTLKVPGENKLMLQGIYPFEPPKPPADEKEIFFHQFKKEDQFWRRVGPPANWKDLTPLKKEKWMREETMRCFGTGAWIMVLGEAIWIPPSFWFLLNWFYTKVGYLSFRFSQLLEEYFEVFCETDPWCIGTFRFKKRRDGLTTRRMARTLWKALQTKDGWFGMQSKTGKDAKTVCWSTLMRGFRRLPLFFLPEMGGMTDPKTMLEFKKPSERITRANRDDLFNNADIFRDSEADDDLNTTLDWRDTVSDAYDGQQTVEITLDEFAKWKKASALDALYTCKRCCLLDGVRVGWIHSITSPPEKDGPELVDCEAVWNESNYDEVKDSGTWQIYRWFTSALDSYAGAIDQYGYCDRNKAEIAIRKEREAAPQRKKKAIMRQTVMTVEEIFEATDTNVFITAPEIKKWKKYLEGITYRDEDRKQLKYVYGNFIWRDGLEFEEVDFVPSENQDDFSFTGRWAIMNYPAVNSASNQWLTKLSKGQLLKYPPLDSEHVIGIDPYDFKRVDSDQASLGAAVIGKCFDFLGNGDINGIDALYNFRPPDPDMFYMDLLKGAIFYGAWANSESRNMKIFDAWEEWGYFEWFLPKDISNPKKRHIKGSPTTNPMIQEICSLIEAFTAVLLNKIWHEAIPADFLNFDPGLTKKSNITMAFGHMLIGFAKRRRLYRKKRKMSSDVQRELAEAIGECLFGV